MRKKLILITSGFPYGSGETFLETEVTYLAKGFEQVHFVAVNPSNSISRNLPDNCTAEGLFIPLGVLQKIAALRYLVSPLFWQERNVIRRGYKRAISRGIAQTMLISLYRAQKIRKHAEKLINGKQQVFYSYWCDDSALALAILKKENPDVKAVSRAHGWDVYFEVHLVNYLPYRHLIAAQLNAILPISNKGKEAIEKIWNLKDLSTVHVSRLGVKGQEKITQPESKLLVSCSNLIPLKRVALIIEGLKKLTFPICWVHFGDGPEMEHLQQLASDLPENVTVEWKGRVTNSEVLNFYKTEQPTAFINVSSSEGIPVSIMEAMSFGIPVIATDVGGTNEIVNNENGILLSADPSEREISDAITSFVEDRERMSLKSTVAYQTWQKHYNADVNYSAFVDALLHHAR